MTKTATPEEAKGATREAPEFVPDEDFRKTVYDIKDALLRNAESIQKWVEMQGDYMKVLKKQHFLDGDSDAGEWADAPTITAKDIIHNKPASELDREIQQLNDEVCDAHLYMRSMTKRRKIDAEYKGVRTLKRLERLQKLLHMRRVELKAAGDFWQTGGTNAGAEWVPTGYASIVIDVHRLDKNVVGIFQTVQIPQGVGAWRIPVKTTRSSWALASEVTAFSNTLTGAGSVNMAGTDYMVLDPLKHKGIAGLSVEETEDAAVAIMQLARQELAMSGMETWESAVINGQPTDSATLDATFGPANANGYAVGSNGGLRFYAVDNGHLVDGGGSSPLTVADIEGAQEIMLQYAVRPNEVAILVPPSGLLDLLSDDDVKSVDQIGGAATLLSGQLASLYGKPIIVSNEIPDMSTAGTVETSANVDKCAIMVNRTRWRIGVKRGMEIRQIDAVGDDAIALVGFMRTCVNHVPGTDPHTVVIHGIN